MHQNIPLFHNLVARILYRGLAQPFPIDEAGRKLTLAAPALMPTTKSATACGRRSRFWQGRPRPCALPVNPLETLWPTACSATGHIIQLFSNFFQAADCLAIFSTRPLDHRKVRTGRHPAKPPGTNGDCKMKLINNDGVKISRKSRPIRSNRKMASWHKDVEALVSSVERAWAAAERMRAAVEDSEPSNPARLRRSPHT